MDSKVLRRRQIWKDFLLYLIGIVLCYSAYVGILNLQSSMNISEGVGITASGVSFTVSFLCVLFLTPTIVRIFALKTCLIMAEVGLLIYIFANFYPKFYLLVPGACCSGFAEGTNWTVMSLINVVFGSMIAELGSKEKDVYIHKMSGYFFTAFQMCQIIGNIMSSILLYSTSLVQFTNTSSTNTTILNSNTTAFQYLYCGSKDCQNEEAVTLNLKQYVPNKVSKYILLSVNAGMCIVGILTHIFFLRVDDKTIKYNTSEEEALTNSKNDGNESKKELMSNESDNNTNTNKVSSETITIKKNFTRTLLQTFKLMLHPRLILLFPLCIYCGLYMGFVFSELTRSYSSCVIGVETVGVCMATYGIADVLASFIFGKFGKIIGHTGFIAFTCLMDIGLWLYCLLSSWSMSNSWSIYLIFFVFGIGDGIWQTATNVLLLEHFPDKREISISLWNMAICIGLAIQFGIGGLLCVNIKIYYMMVILVIGCICTGLAEILYSREKSRNQDNPNH